MAMDKPKKKSPIVHAKEIARWLAANDRSNSVQYSPSRKGAWT